MRAVVQRVVEAHVSIGETRTATIGPGLCVLLGIGKGDHERNTESLAKKIANLRIFSDAEGKLNRSVIDIQGEVLVVSQFTLYGDCRKGNRPSFSEAAPPATAESLYEHFILRLRGEGITVATGRFQAVMQIALVNDGPVTLIIEG